MLKIAFCDDDVDFLKKIKAKVRALLAQQGMEAVLAEYSDPCALVAEVGKDRQLYDVFFVDLNMDKLSGFAVAEHINMYNPERTLIFVTSMEGHVKEGYQYNAFRFVFKSALEEELEELFPKLLSRYRHRLRQTEQVELKVMRGGELYESLLFAKGDIIYFEVGSFRRTRLHTTKGSYDLLVRPLRDYLRLLDSPDFKIHLRAYLVNMAHIQKIHETEYVLTDGKRLSLGHSRTTIAKNRALFLRYVHERI